ncbi:potassium-transporting ATPase subunit F [Agrococcus sp. 1P02AA]
MIVFEVLAATLAIGAIGLLVSALLHPERF